MAVELNEIKEYYPGCKIIENDESYEIYAKADSIFDLVIDKSKNDLIVGNKSISLFRVQNKYLNPNDSLTDPRVIVAYLDDVIKDGYDRREDPNLIRINLDDKSDIIYMIKALYDAYTKMLNSYFSFDEEDSKLLNIHVYEDSLDKYAKQLSELKSRLLNSRKIDKE